MFHLAAYTGTVSAGTNVDVPALTDNMLSITNGHFLPQVDYQMLYALATGASVTAARLTAPSIRYYSPKLLEGAVAAALPGADPPVTDMRKNPLAVTGLEELAFEATDTVAMGTERVTGLIAITQGLQPAPAGTVFTVRGASTTAAVANSWTQLAVTWDDNLPAGNYACVGLSVWSTNSQAARLLFENQVPRPGCIGRASFSVKEWMGTRAGGMGVWGQFSANRMPLVEVLCNSTDSAHTIALDFMRY